MSSTTLLNRSSGEHIWVVGESFLGTAEAHENVWTVAALVHSIDRGDWHGRKARIAAGLGVDDAAWSYLQQRIAVAGLADTLVAVVHPVTPVGRHAVVKRQQDDVLIGDARTSSDHDAQAQLVVPNDTPSLRQDLRLWQHVPGFLLIEAASQLTIWGASRLGVLAGRPGLVVQQACRADFRRFVFPVTTRLALHVRPRGPARADRVPFTATVEAVQAGRTAAEVAFDAVVFDAERVFSLEHEKAEYVVEAPCVAAA